MIRIKSRILDMIDNRYINNLAKNEAFDVSNIRT